MKNLLKSIFALPVLAVVGLLGACGGGGSSVVPSPTPAPTVISIVISPASPTLKMGDAPLQLTASASYSDGTVAPITTGITWNSQLNAVSTTGLVTAKATGRYPITASFTNKNAAGVTLNTVEGTAFLNVPSVTKIEISPSSATLIMGKKQALAVKATYSDNSTSTLTSGVTITSKLNTVATTGTVTELTATTAGSDTITATYNNLDVDGKISGAVVGTATIRVPIPGYVPLAAGGNQTIAPMSDGQFYGWGHNLQGQLGDTTITNRTTPILLTGENNNWKSIAMGKDFTVAVKQDGSLWSWGNNPNGQLGNGSISTTPIPYPVRIGADNDWEMVAAGKSHAMAIKKTGELFAWGANSEGQLGDGKTNSLLQPTKIEFTPAGAEAPLGWIKVACGDAHTIGIDKDGSMHVWGDNRKGQLGIGDLTITQKLLPTQVGTKKWSLVAAGSNHSVAIQTDSSLWAWGANNNGQVGNGASTDVAAPEQVGTKTDWLQVAAGSEHTIAVSTTGTLWTWGNNLDGQLGNGVSAVHLVPTQISTTKAWTQVSAGANHSVAFDNEGLLWSWGRNDEGQQGNGRFLDVSTPTQVKIN